MHAEHRHQQNHEERDMLSSPLITGSRGTMPVTSPSLSKLPGLQYAISHPRRTDLRLPSFAMAYDSSCSSSQDAQSPSSSSSSMGNGSTGSNGLRLSVAHCETPHFMAGVSAFCPEASPTDKTPASLAASLESCLSAEELKRRKKGTRRGTLNPEAKNVLKAWMFSPEHFAHPYPSEEEKEELASEAGIEVKQLSNWFTNARKRLWQPVLRQSGVEVKNFLSTGRGGPRGNKLDVPANIQSLVPASPPSSPERHCKSSSSSTTSSSPSPLKRTWSDMEASLPSANPSSADESSLSASNSQAATEGVNTPAIAPAAPKRKKTTTGARKKSAKDASSRKDGDAPAMTKIANQLSHELRLALVERAAMAMGGAPTTSTMQVSPHESPGTIQDLEILVATSLIGLHKQYQSVH